MAFVCILTCCRSGSPNDAGAIEVKLEDFKLILTTTTAATGPITLHLDNLGPSTHEFNVDRTDVPANQLPLRADGLSVAENSPSLKRIGSVEIVEAGDSAKLRVNLPPGRYVLYCNLEGHYLGHMYATLDVH